MFTELEKIAWSLAETGVFGNPYDIPTGPTAHCAPVYPFLLSLIYRLLGLGAAAHFVVLLMNAVFACLQHALLPLLAAACGFDRRIGLAAGLFGALVPLRLLTELTGWEAPLTGLLWVLMTLATVRWREAAQPSPAASALYGAGWGLVFLVSPQMLFVFLLGLVPLLRNGGKSPRAWLSAGAVLLGVLVVILPWTVRNRLQFGGWFFIRSNFGIELAQANHDGAGPITNTDPQKDVSMTYERRRHPYTSRTEAEELKSMGEVPYNGWRIREATNWIRAHPEEFARLTVQRMIYFWFFPSKAPKGKNVVLFPMVGLAFWGLVKMLRAAPGAGWLFLSGWLAFPLVYYVIQLMTRYRYPLEWSIAFLCAFALLHRTGGKREAPAEV